MEQQSVKSDKVVVVPLYFPVLDTGAGDQYFVKTQWETDIVRASRGDSVSPSKDLIRACLVWVGLILQRRICQVKEDEIK
jgi:hypothetical protein